MTIVALSASYGAGGSRIGPALAERLGLPFVDRAIPMAEAAQRIEVPDDPATLVADRPARVGWLERALRGFVGAESAVPGPIPTVSGISDDFRRQSEDVLRRQVQSGDGVILGRAAVAVLRDDPRVLRVRLDGEPERRIEQAVRLFGVDRQTAAEAVSKLDLAHDAYLKEFYGADIRDPALYHVMLDSTALPLQTCVAIIAEAATALATADSDKRVRQRAP
jgi:cytidylate kinase